jgi:acyl carrier protein
MSPPLSGDEVCAAIANALSLPRSAVSTGAPLEDLVPASFMLIEMVLELQDRFGVRLSQEDFREVRTVGDLVALIGKHRS